MYAENFNKLLKIDFFFFNAVFANIFIMWPKMKHISYVVLFGTHVSKTQTSKE